MAHGDAVYLAPSSGVESTSPDRFFQARRNEEKPKYRQQLVLRNAPPPRFLDATFLLIIRSLLLTIGLLYLHLGFFAYTWAGGAFLLIVGACWLIIEALLLTVGSALVSTRTDCKHRSSNISRQAVKSISPQRCPPP